jgi:MinD superfamily P-loop ATPase
VAGRSRVVVETVRRMLRFLSEMRVPICGVVENMAREPDVIVAKLARHFDVPFLGALPFDAHLEDAHGRAAQITRTAMAAALRVVANEVCASWQF